MKKSEKQRFDDYVNFTLETSKTIIKDTFIKGAENKLAPSEVLSVFRSCLIIGTRYVIDTLIEQEKFDEAETVIKFSIEESQDIEEFNNMKTLIETARKNKHR